MIGMQGKASRRDGLAAIHPMEHRPSRPGFEDVKKVAQSIDWMDDDTQDVCALCLFCLQHASEVSDAVVTKLDENGES